MQHFNAYHNVDTLIDTMHDVNQSLEEENGVTEQGIQEKQHVTRKRKEASLRKLFVFRQALPPLQNNHLDDVTPCEWARRVALDLECQPNFWVPREVIEDDHDEGWSDGERIVKRLYSIVKDHLQNVEEKEGRVWIGAEYWAQVYKGGRGLAFHVDKDEHAMKHRREMINPLYSSVLYLTGEEVLQSPTVITDEHYDEKLQRMVPLDFPTESALVFPKDNRYCLFDGRCGHGVLDVNRDDDVRITFLVNWWETKPESVERCTASEKRANTVFDDGESHAMREPRLELTVTKEYLLGNEPFMMDEFLQSHGILNSDNVWEETSRPIVVMRHSGIIMIPDQRMYQNDDDDIDNKPLIDAALISSEKQSLFMS